MGLRRFYNDRCGKYYDKSTLETGPRLYKNKNTTVLDLCEECKVSLIDWLNHEEYNEENIESFIKHKAFTMGKNGTTPYILVSHFLDGLKKFFDYKGNGEVDDFINNNSLVVGIIGIKKVKECLAKYFDYEWKDAFYG